MLPINHFEKESYGIIQLKGTDLCMDVRCICGEMSHIDGEFIDLIECCGCHKIFRLNFFIKLDETKPEAGEDIHTTTNE